MMVIRGTTTNHAVAASTAVPNGFGPGADLFWVYNATSELFEPNTNLQTLLDEDSTTHGPWRVLSVSAISRRGNGGTASPNAGINTAILPFIRFDDNSNISVAGARFLTNTAGDTIEATRANTQIIQRASVIETIYPADRCTWEVSPDGSRGYQINNAQFFPGDAAAVNIAAPALGYIGKSGRFVEIAG